MQSSSSRSRTKPTSIALPPALPQFATPHAKHHHFETYLGPPHADVRQPSASPVSMGGNPNREMSDDSRSEYTYKVGQSSQGGYKGSSPEDNAGHRYDGNRSPRSQSPASPRSRHSGMTPDESARRLYDGLARSGSGGSSSFAADGGEADVEQDPRRRSRVEQDKARVFAKRFGEKPPFILDHPDRQKATSEQYPGVVLGSFAGGIGGPGFGFGEHSVGIGEMDGILDFSQPRQDGRHDSASGPAPNIAPWLAEDKANESRSSSADRSGTHTPGDFAASQYGSQASLPQVRRNGTEQNLADGAASSSTSRSGSHPEIFPVPPPDSSASSINDQHARHGSTDSVQTLPGGQQPASLKKMPQPFGDQFVAPGGGRGSVAGSKLRLGSKASDFGSTGSADSGKQRKGLFGGFLKRKPTGVPTNIGQFQPCTAEGGAQLTC